MASNYPTYPVNQAMTGQMPQMAQQPITQQSLMQHSNFQQANFFPQPVGNVYSLNTASEIGNIPIGAGISVGLCLNENMMFIKSFQNGAPMLLSYQLNAGDGLGATSTDDSVLEAAETKNKKLIEIIERYDDKIKNLEAQMSRLRERVGGKVEWQV